MRKSPESFTSFQKDPGDLLMLQRAIESPDTDQEIIPIVRRFLALPITPLESCYGHPNESKLPYLSYVLDETSNQQALESQRLFTEKISQLASVINQRLDTNLVEIQQEETNHGSGPIDYTIRFVIPPEIFRQNGNQILGTIWDEFLNILHHIS